ncbi:unnamed protein product [Blepharisma stoltei]|uniref:Anaphase-promoting complex subunit 1 middle domain-containing protein n=1 Tax=Blepharisma stoltei TaxID=1481888 RepID=A0AAU9JGS8_9CILI|nr:unnamed protein product [Blepharisma stoltei]
MADFSEAGPQVIEICEGGISLYGKDGNRYAVPVPQQLVQVFYISDGLILKCKAEKKFHHSQVLGSAAITAPLYTYLVLTKHPYSDLYPLADIQKNLWVSTHIDIVYTSKRFPLFIAYDSSINSHAIYLIRVNLELLNKETIDMASLDPNKRDDFFSKHVGSEPLLVVEKIYEISDSMCRFSHIDIAVPTDPQEMMIYLQSQEKIRILRYRLENDKGFPYNCIEEISAIENAIEFKTVKRSCFISHKQPINTETPTLSFFLSQTQEFSSFLYVYSKSHEIHIYDGQYLLCVLSPSDITLSPSENSLTSCMTIPIEINHSLIKKCMGVLYLILPPSLYQTIQADLIHRLLTSRIRTENDNFPDKGKDKSNEWALFSSLIISLLKESKNKTDSKRPRLAYSNEAAGESDSLWDNLLSSRFHFENKPHFKKIFPEHFSETLIRGNEGISLELKTCPSTFTRHIFTILKAWHLLYEDMKLDMFERSAMVDLGGLIYVISRQLGKYGTNLAEYYYSEIKDTKEMYRESGENIEKYLEANVEIEDFDLPNIYSWLKSVLNNQNPPQMPILLEKTRKICRIFECLSIYHPLTYNFISSTKEDTNMDSDLALSQSFPILTYSLNPYQKKIISLNSSSPFEKIIEILVNENFTELNLQSLPPAFSLIIYEIIRKIQLNPPASSNTWPKEALEFIHRVDIHLNNELVEEKHITLKGQPFEEQYEQILKLELDKEEDLGSGLVEYIFPNDLRLEEAQCMLDVTRAIKMRLPDNVVSEEQFEAEKHNLLYKICLKRASTAIGYGALTLGTSKASPTSASQVPQINFSAFLPPNFDVKMNMPQNELETREKDFMVWPKFHIGVATGLKMLSENPKDYVKNRQWITYHRGEEESNEHAGFIFSLGLLGQLEALHDLDIYRYLRAEQESIIIAIYLGTAASALGSMDEKIMRLLRISIAFLIPPFVDIDIKLTQEAASMMGFGLLYKESGNRQVTEMLLVQLGRKALTNKDIEREGLSLAAGLALGIVNLASEGKTPGLEDLVIDERLIRLFEGGRRMAPPKILQTGYLMSESAKCSVAKEGDNIVTTITAPGALLAYALIHLKSNNALVAEKIEIPTTFYALEWVRPEHVMIKILAKNLILWDSIQATKDWIYSQIPEIIRFCFENDLKTVQNSFQERGEIDFNAISNSYLYIIGGALLSLGFKYVGSGDTTVAALISDEILKIKDLKATVLGGPVDFTDQNKNSVEKHALFTVICAGALALGLVMAGTGDLSTFKIIKLIRKRVEGDYGFNMAHHMAVGFLFMGNCQYSFSSSNFAIAALLASIYPKFPATSADNRHHLQAFRHLYVLALEKRLLVTKDADTKILAHVPIEVEYSDIGTRTENSPFLLRPLNLVKQLKVVGKDYYNYNLDIKAIPKLVLYTKRQIAAHELESGAWNWLKKLGTASPEEIENWIGSASTPEKFIETQEIIIPQFLDQQDRIKKNTILFKLLQFCISQNKPELISQLFSIFYSQNNDFECVLAFYKKLAIDYQDSSYSALQEFISSALLSQSF